MASEVHEFVETSFRDHFLDCTSEMMDFLFFFHQLLLEFGHFIKELLGVLIVLFSMLKAMVIFGPDKLGDVIKIIGVEILVLFVYMLLLFFFLVEVVHGSDLLLFSAICFPLELLHEFDLVCETLPPELLPLVIFNLPVGKFLLKIFDVIIVGVMNSHVILFFLLE